LAGPGPSPFEAFGRASAHPKAPQGDGTPRSRVIWFNSIETHSSRKPPRPRTEHAGVAQHFTIVDQDPIEQTLRRQLTAFSQFSSRSLNEATLDALMLDASIRARAGIGVTHAKLMEYLPSRDRLLLRAGVGWRDGYVGQYQVAPDIDSPIGHSFVL